ncbi:MAG: sulfatase-like hydrolase/transferase [Bacteroidales bacterium]|nr:sulfatase-like hydrolase/transferase [Bacteroidales bacterium]
MKTCSPLALAAISGAAVCGSACGQQKTPARPNVVLIVADDLGYGDVSCYGSRTIMTPCLDSLAAAGVLFNNAYATSATSSPSRYAMFTGIYPWRADMRILPGDAPLMIPVDMPTMPKMFQELGYATGAVGKWHLGMGEGYLDWNQPITPAANTVGFDFTNIIPATVDRVPTVYVENGLVVGLDPDDPIKVSYKEPFPGEITGKDHPELMTMPFHHGHNGTIINGIPRIGHMVGGKSALWDDATMADYFLGKSKNFIDEHADEPFFLYYGLHEPHVPRTAMDRFAGSTEYGVRGDVIAEADWLVGQIVSHLREKGLLDNTIIIFTSDNGPVVQDGYCDGSDEKIGDHDPNGGLRGGKYSLFDGGTHVPMIVYWPDAQGGKVSDEFVCQMDFWGSFAAMLGVELPEGLDTRNTLEAFMGGKGGRTDQVIEAMGRLGLRDGDYVLMPPYNGPFSNETGNELGNLKDYGLYNLRSDKHQDVNLAGSQPELLEAIKAKFLQAVGKHYNPKREIEALK